MFRRCFRFLDLLISGNGNTPTRMKKWRSNYNHHQEGDSRLASCGAMIVGSSMGLLCYWSLTPHQSNSAFSFAVCDGESHTSGDHLLPETHNEKKQRFLFGDAYRRRVFFNYEKRIRMQSSPKKVFEYFASIERPSGEVLMTPADLMRAIVPVFPPSESSWVREGSLKGERGVPAGKLYCQPSEFFMLFDTNGDGLISFPEYLFFVTILSIPETSFSIAFKMFDIDNSGEIDSDEFKKVMNLMRSPKRSYGNSHHNHRGSTGKRKLMEIKAADQSNENSGLLEYFFGKDGNKKLQHDIFVQFLRDLHEEILRLEFAHYDFRSRGTISAKDFALSLVASADMSHTNKLLDKVEEMDNEPSLKDLRITFKEFKDFSDLRKELQSFSLALFSYGKVNGLLTKKDFQRAASQVCGIKLTDKVVDIIFHVFKTDTDTTLDTSINNTDHRESKHQLSSKEFVRVIQRRETTMQEVAVQHREPGFGGLASCWSSCASRCKSSKPLL
ncbi:hypothetical protein SAY86_002401 [Trapa natans]|uniref:EF-hand domain-containing protein n=1 Tax=Trapa natans TaxID=22666 RepID=A0AAN7LFL3_TRANT|nr:hypothetical protein SAY86_002401 [Trapa natans]